LSGQSNVEAGATPDFQNPPSAGFVLAKFFVDNLYFLVYNAK
jgi:hypothetical protein